MKRRKWTTPADYIVECEDCGWQCQARNGLGLAAQHHDRTGHKVRTEVSYTVIYAVNDNWKTAASPATTKGGE